MSDYTHRPTPFSSLGGGSYQTRPEAGAYREDAGSAGSTSGLHIRDMLRDCCRLPSAQVNVSEGERIASFIGGSIIAVAGLRTGSWIRLALLALGGSLIYRGIMGHCYAYQALNVDTSHRNQLGVAPNRGIHVAHAVTVSRSPAELFESWRHIDRLPQILGHIREVSPLGGNRSHWVAQTPLGVKLEWDAQSIVRDDNRSIAWRSEPGSQLQTAGSIRFDDAPGGRGTEVRVSMDYDLPGGALTEQTMEWFGAGLKDCVADDLREFKRRYEADEAPTTVSQPTGTEPQS